MYHIYHRDPPLWYSRRQWIKNSVDECWGHRWLRRVDTASAASAAGDNRLSMSVSASLQVSGLNSGVVENANQCSSNFS